ncbi:MAG: glutamine--fructose-6-phosphate transaminase (isomerizing) [Acidilobaceae archaeon]|nr:glutamine--fructose-6-phosphate transaminase (isomerizing) [Acidilobaceae archaeon]
MAFPSRVPPQVCGIIGVCSRSKNVSPMISLGLRRLEYRGYDSVGAALLVDKKIMVWKAKGDVESFLRKFKLEEKEARTGIGHTRWATHGAPNDVNAHPHSDCSGKIAVVHNGVIRNFFMIKSVLEKRGHKIVSETDTELIVHLIEDELPFSSSFFEAFYRTISRLEGSFAVVVIYSEEPDKIYFAKMKSPLIVGLGEGFNIVASDIPAIIDHTRRVLALEDGEIGWISPSEVRVFSLTDHGVVELSREKLAARLITVDWSFEEANRLGYPHFMLKEIVEQPLAVKSTYEGNVEDPLLSPAASLILEAKHVIVLGAGTSFHAGMALSYYLAKSAKTASIPLISSEYKAAESFVGERDVVVAISQSGETYDTLEAVMTFKRAGAKVIGITNVVGSALSREAHLVIYMRSGPEIGVAATKTFTSQLMTASLLAIRVAAERGVMSEEEAKKALVRLSLAPEILKASIDRSMKLLKGAPLGGVRSMYVLGRGLGHIIAKEAALKIKEISYVHAESYPAGESKHGPIALVEPGFPVYFAVTSDSAEIGGNVMEMAARGARVVAVKPEDLDLHLPHGAEAVNMPAAGGDILLEPYSIVPYFQLLAYQEAVARGYNPDKPRNLAKTVTVE